MVQNPSSTTPEDIAYAARYGCPLQLLAALRKLPVPVNNSVFVAARVKYGLRIPEFNINAL